MIPTVGRRLTQVVASLVLLVLVFYGARRSSHRDDAPRPFSKAEEWREERGFEVEALLKLESSWAPQSHSDTTLVLNHWEGSSSSKELDAQLKVVYGFEVKPRAVWVCLFNVGNPGSFSAVTSSWRSRLESTGIDLTLTLSSGDLAPAGAGAGAGAGPGRVSGRFYLALQATTKYVWVLDPLVVPGKSLLGLLSHAINTREARGGLQSAAGSSSLAAVDSVELSGQFFGEVDWLRALFWSGNGALRARQACEDSGGAMAGGGGCGERALLSQSLALFAGVATFTLVSDPMHPEYEGNTRKGVAQVDRQPQPQPSGQAPAPLPSSESAWSRAMQALGRVLPFAAPASGSRTRLSEPRAEQQQSVLLLVVAGQEQAREMKPTYRMLVSTGSKYAVTVLLVHTDEEEQGGKSATSAACGQVLLALGAVDNEEIGNGPPGARLDAGRGLLSTQEQQQLCREGGGSVQRRAAAVGDTAPGLSFISLPSPPGASVASAARGGGDGLGCLWLSKEVGRVMRSVLAAHSLAAVVYCSSPRPPQQQQQQEQEEEEGGLQSREGRHGSKCLGRLTAVSQSRLTAVSQSVETAVPKCANVTLIPLACSATQPSSKASPSNPVAGGAALDSLLPSPSLVAVWRRLALSIVLVCGGEEAGLGEAKGEDDGGAAKLALTLSALQSLSILEDDVALHVVLPAALAASAGPLNSFSWPHGPLDVTRYAAGGDDTDGAQAALEAVWLESADHYVLVLHSGQRVAKDLHLRLKMVMMEERMALLARAGPCGASGSAAQARGALECKAGGGEEMITPLSVSAFTNTEDEVWVHGKKAWGALQTACLNEMCSLDAAGVALDWARQTHLSRFRQRTVAERRIAPEEEKGAFPAHQGEVLTLWGEL